jgi:hypothetical protein
LGQLADAEPPYPTHHPDVESRVLQLGDDDLVLVQHRGWTDRVDDATEVPRDADIIYDRSGRNDGALGPKGARVYRFKAR